MTLWLGTYREPGGRGLYPLERHGSGLHLGEPEERIQNASFAVVSSEGVTYFVDEQDAGRVTAWRRKDGAWAFVGECSSGGSAPCYLALSPDEQWLAVANYADGTVGLIRLEADGKVGGLMDTVRPSGRGVDPERQDGPHAHCVVFEEGGRALYHVDLGLDRVFRHRIGNNGFEDTTIAYQALPRAGPRHLIFHHDGEHALLICELDAHLVLLRRSGGSLTCVDRVPACPEQAEDNLGGHLALAPTGEVWVTNRGHDSIVRFDIRDGKLRRGEWYPTGGSSPRHFVIEDGRAIVAHEESGGVVSTTLSSDVRSRLDVPAAAFLVDIPE